MREREIALLLPPGQIGLLAEVCATYRSYAWQNLPPTPERNQTLKAVQAVQGRLAVLRAWGDEPIRLMVHQEEISALRLMLRTLMQAWGRQLPSPVRDRYLATLAQVRLLLERGRRQAAVS